jgi:hypothetical protein
VVQSTKQIHDASVNAAINLRIIDDKLLGVTFDESITPDDLVNLLNVFGSAASAPLVQLSGLSAPSSPAIPQYAKRTSDFLSQPVFNKHHSETEMLRYMNHLASKDLGLANAMIPLGSCTMKLNSTSSMAPITWPEFSTIHPFAPLDQTKGYLTVIKVNAVNSVYAHLSDGTFRNWKRIYAKSLASTLLRSSLILELLESTLVYGSSRHTTSLEGREGEISASFLSAPMGPIRR